MPPANAPIDEIFSAPLAEFVATRDRLAAELVRQGRKDEGQALKKLRRPSASAWATNQVVREARAAVDEMLAASDRLRRAQDALLAGRSDQVAYQAAVDDLRRATGALDAASRDVLERAGRSARELVDGVIANVRVAALDGERRRELLEGRLAADLEAADQGISAFMGAGLGPGPAAGAARPVAPKAAPPTPATSLEDARREKEKREAHARQLEIARSEAASAREVAGRAETGARAARAAYDAAAARVDEAERVLAAERESLGAAKQALDTAEKHLTRVAAEAKAAGHRLDALDERS